MKYKISDTIVDYAEGHDSDEAEALLECLNEADEKDIPADNNAIIRAAVKFLDVLVAEGEITLQEKKELLDLEEVPDEPEPEDEYDALSEALTED